MSVEKMQKLENKMSERWAEVLDRSTDLTWRMMDAVEYNFRSKKSRILGVV